MQQNKTITLKIILLIFLDNANIWTWVVQIYKKAKGDTQSPFKSTSFIHMAWCQILTSLTFYSFWSHLAQ